MPGPYRVAVTPYLKEILDCVTSPEVEKVVCQKSSQVAWTDGVTNNAIGYYIDHDPSPILALFPTDKLVERYSKEKLTPMIRDTSALRRKVADSKSRDSGNTMHSKRFPGGHLELVGSNSPGNLSSSPIRIVIVEEPDRCAVSSGREGNSLKLAYARTPTFHNRKFILGGSPTLKGESDIEREMEMSDQRRYYIPCPHCGEFQTLEWKDVIWDKKEGRNHPVYGDHCPETAAIACKKCGACFSNSDKNKQLVKGEWRSSSEFTGVAGFYINELYSPFPKATLSDVVAKFLEAKKALIAGDPTLMIVWTNTSLGETWDDAGESIDDDAMLERCEQYQAEVPMGGLVLTAGVDVQGDRLEMEILAHGIESETWSVDYKVIHGDPALPETWALLDGVLMSGFQHESGRDMRIVSCCIDTGGHHTTEVYKFCKSRFGRRVFAIKGASIPNKPLVSRPSRSNSQKVRLFTVGTDTAKDLLFNRLKLDTPGPGYCHFPAHYDEHYFGQLTAEKAVPKWVRGRKTRVWVPKSKRRRNEALDCRVYAMAAFELLNANMESLESVVKATAKEIPLIPTPQRNRRRQISAGVQM